MRAIAFWLVFLLGNLLKNADGSIDNVISEYAKEKLTRQCFGEEIYISISQKVIQALTECVSGFSNNRDGGSSTPTQGDSNRPPKYDVPITPNRDVPVLANRDTPTAPKLETDEFKERRIDANFIREKHLEGGRQPEDIFGGRWKRAIANDFVLYFEARVRDLKNNVLGHYSVYQCIFKKLDYVTTDLKINYEYMAREIKSFKLNYDLETDLMKGLEYCKQYTSCLPINPTSTALPVELKRLTSFIKCYDQQTSIACMKNDLREHEDEFQLQGLDGILNRLDKADQMLTVVWSDIEFNRKDDENIVF